MSHESCRRDQTTRGPGHRNADVRRTTGSNKEASDGSPSKRLVGDVALAAAGLRATDLRCNVDASARSETEFGAWSEYVTTSSFFVSHVVGSILASALLMLGVVALSLKLATSRRARAAHAAVFATVLGTMGVVAVFGIAPFAQPADRQRFSLGD